MAAQAEGPGEEIKGLRRSINDLVSILALPAMWTGGGPSQIVGTLLDALLGMLGLDLLYARVDNAPGEAPLEMLRLAPQWEPKPRPQEIRGILQPWLGVNPEDWPSALRNPSGGGDLSILPLPLGLQCEIGMIVAGSLRTEFPQQTERLVLNVAANQAAIGLHGARLLVEQKRVTRELDDRVAQRTAELATTSTELRKESAERKRKEDKLRLNEEALREAHEQIARSEERWRSVFGNSAIGVALTDLNGHFIATNPVFQKMLGYGKEELQKLTFLDITHEQYLERNGALIGDLLDGTRGQYQIEKRYRRKDGSLVWVRNNVSIVPGSDRVARFLMTLSEDITERKQAEEKLKRSEADLHEAQRISQTGSWKLDLRSGRVTVTPEVFRRYAVRPEAQDTSSPEFWFDRIHPEDRQRARERFERCMAGRTEYEDDYRIVLPDGSVKYQHSIGHPILDESGALVEFLGTIVDVTAQVQARVALENAFDEIKKSEVRLRQVIDTIPTLAWCNLPDGPNEFLNKGWHEYTGLSPEESHGWGWQVAFHPEDLPAVMEKWRELLASGEAGEIEARLRRHDGAYRWFLIRVEPLCDGAGKIVRWYGTSTDIDDRKRAEEHLRRSELFLAEGQILAQVGTFSWRVANDEITWSDQLYRIFEFDRSAPVTLERIASRVYPEDLPILHNMIERARSAATDFEYEHRLLMPDQSVKYVHLIAHANRDEQGRPEYLGAAQDVTEHRMSQQALDEARSELARVARVMSFATLTASIAHEVNQPLAGIVTNASTCLRMLAADPPNLEGARETVRRTIRDGNRASEVVSRLRTLYERKAPMAESVDLNEAAREVIALSFTELQRGRVLLRPEFADDLPLVTGDRVQLQQVILNLLRNASEAMSAVDDRPRELFLRTERDEGDRVRLCVKDVGAGLDPLAMDKLFEAFYTTKSDGMGIGLSVSRSIIESHHGRLWAAPNDGPGATFSFSLPCRADTKVQ
jgi:PAS domain S-box-containing protein